MGQDPRPAAEMTPHTRGLRRKESALYILSHMFWAGLSLILCALLAFGIYGYLQQNDTLAAIRHSQVQNHSTLQRTKQAAVSSATTLHILHDCLTPGGTCYEQAQANQKAVLNQVVHIVEYTVQCNNDPQVDHDLPALEGCVGSLIKERGL